MSVLSDPRWPFLYPDGGADFNPWQGHFTAQANSIATLLNGYKLPLFVADAADRDAKFPSPEDGDRVVRADHEYVTELYSDGAWRTLAGGFIQAQRFAAQTISNNTETRLLLTGATVLARGYLGGTLATSGTDNGLLTIDEDGLYEVRGQVTFAAGGSPYSRAIFLKQNATTVQGTVIQTDDAVTVNVEALIDATASDTISIAALQTSGGDRTTFPTAAYPTQLIAKRIG